MGRMNMVEFRERNGLAVVAGLWSRVINFLKRYLW